MLYESNYLLEWIERRYPEPPLLPTDDDGILEVKQLMVLADGIMVAGATIIRELTWPPSSEAWLARYRDKITRATEVIDEAIGAAEFAHRNCFGQADKDRRQPQDDRDTMTGLFGQQIELGALHQRLPRLAAYVAAIDERPSFVATRPCADAVRSREGLRLTGPDGRRSMQQLVIPAKAEPSRSAYAARVHSDRLSARTATQRHALRGRDVRSGHPHAPASQRHSARLHERI